MTGSLNCQFCVCDDPRFSIAWPESTTPAPTTTTTPRPTLPEGQWMANNIIYTKLKNPCSEFYAACPLLCKRGNFTYTNGTTCETCTCERDFFNIIGKREYPGKISLHRREAVRYNHYSKNGHGPRPCFHFGCPIFRCPEGLRFAISPTGCEECRCIPIDPPTTSSPQISTTAPGNENFIQMYCRKEPSDCPPGCSVVDFRVTDWHCYHCHCPENNYVALQKPCDQQNFLCSSTCAVRNLVNSKNQTDSCEFCDCTPTARYGRGHKISKRDTQCPMHCPHFCHFGRQKSSDTIFQALGRRKRQTMGCFGDCSHCPYNNQLLEGNLQTTIPTSPSKVHHPELHFPRNCFQEKSEFVNKNCVRTFELTISGKMCHICELYNTEGQLVYLEHSRHVTADHCFTSKYREFLTNICAHVSEVHTSSDVCLLCTYKTQQNEIIILQRNQLQTILQQNHISIQQTESPNTHRTITSTPTLSTKHFTTKEQTTHKRTTESIPTTVVTSRDTIPTTKVTTTVAPPSTTTKAAPPTTTTTVAPSTKTTTSTPSTTTTSTPKTTTVAPPMCHTCSNVTCSSADLQECNTGSEYCMNTLIQQRDGSRIITRGCVSEDECYNKWWIVSADNPSCLSKKNTPTGRPGAPIECNYCCKGAGCNQLMRIPDSLLYTGEDHPSNAMGGIIQIG
ncbi:uncharacterized protein LOC134250227 isoform X2 [Saccostrea cucullata]